MNVSPNRHRRTPLSEDRRGAASRPVASAALAAALVTCIYHIPGSSVAADALRAACAGLACCVLLAWLRARNAIPQASAGSAPSPALPPTAAAVGLLVAACAGCLGDAWARQGAGAVAWTVPDAGTLALLALSCLGTAAWEEALFRRLAPDAFAPQLPAGRGRDLACACVCAGLFALLHARGMGSAGLTALRFAQVVLFGLVMAGVVARGGLGWAVALHAAFDLVSFTYGAGLAAGAGAGVGPGLLALPAETLLTGCVSPAGLGASVAVLAPLALLAARTLLADGREEGGV